MLSHSLEAICAHSAVKAYECCYCPWHVLNFLVRVAYQCSCNANAADTVLISKATMALQIALIF